MDGAGDVLCDGVDDLELSLDELIERVGVLVEEPLGVVLSEEDDVLVTVTDAVPVLD